MCLIRIGYLVAYELFLLSKLQICFLWPLQMDNWSVSTGAERGDPVFPNEPHLILVLKSFVHIKIPVIIPIMDAFYVASPLELGLFHPICEGIFMIQTGLWVRPFPNTAILQGPAKRLDVHFGAGAISHFNSYFLTQPPSDIYIQVNGPWRLFTQQCKSLVGGSLMTRAESWTDVFHCLTSKHPFDSE